MPRTSFLARVDDDLTPKHWMVHVAGNDAKAELASTIEQLVYLVALEL